MMCLHLFVFVVIQSCVNSSHCVSFCIIVILYPIAVPQRMLVMSKCAFFPHLLPLSPWLNALTVITILCCHHFPWCTMGIMSLQQHCCLSCFLFLSSPGILAKLQRLSRNSMSAFTVRACLCVCLCEESVIGSPGLCAIVCVLACMFYVCAVTVRATTAGACVYLLSCLPSCDKYKWIAEFLFHLFLPQANCYFGHTGASPITSINQRAGMCEGGTTPKERIMITGTSSAHIAVIRWWVAKLQPGSRLCRLMVWLTLMNVYDCHNSPSWGVTSLCCYLTKWNPWPSLGFPGTSGRWDAYWNRSSKQSER